MILNNKNHTKQYYCQNPYWHDFQPKGTEFRLHIFRFACNIENLPVDTYEAEFIIEDKKNLYKLDMQLKDFVVDSKNAYFRLK